VGLDDRPGDGEPEPATAVPSRTGGLWVFWEPAQNLLR